MGYKKYQGVVQQLPPKVYLALGSNAIPSNSRSTPMISNIAPGQASGARSISNAPSTTMITAMARRVSGFIIIRVSRYSFVGDLSIDYTTASGRHNSWSAGRGANHYVYAIMSMTEIAMKKLKHEAELFKGALLAGVKYAEGRGVVEFEPTDSASEKLLYIYRLLVHDKVIQPLPEEQVAEKTLRHKLAIWYSKQLPKDHPLLQ
jgi:hypothetical protein